MKKQIIIDKIESLNEDQINILYEILYFENKQQIKNIDARITFDNGLPFTFYTTLDKLGVNYHWFVWQYDGYKENPLNIGAYLIMKLKELFVY